jgi:hypothetical protein
MSSNIRNRLDRLEKETGADKPAFPVRMFLDSILAGADPPSPGWEMPPDIADFVYRQVGKEFHEGLTAKSKPSRAAILHRHGPAERRISDSA